MSRRGVDLLLQVAVLQELGLEKQKVSEELEENHWHLRKDYLLLLTSLCIRVRPVSARTRGAGAQCNLTVANKGIYGHNPHYCMTRAQAREGMQQGQLQYVMTMLASPVHDGGPKPHK